MINLKKTYFFSIIGIFVISLSSFIMADDSVYLWDLGVKIDSKSESVEIINSKMTTVNVDKKYAALTKRHVNPKMVNIDLKRSGESAKKQFSQEFSTLNYLEQYKLGNKYFTSGRYVEAIKLLEMVDFTKLSNKQKTRLMQLHADALFNLGQHHRVVHILTENKEYNLNDELLFLLGLSSTKLGNKKIALNAFNQIIEKYPLSEYQNMAKLQVKVLRR